MQQENRIENGSLLFRYAKGPSITNASEIHPYHEILYFIGDTATFLTQKEKLSLKKGALVLIPKECYHQFSIQNQDLYERCVLNFPDIAELSLLIESVMKEILIIPQIPSTIQTLFNQLIQSFSLPFSVGERSILLQAAFAQILLELKLLSSKISVTLRSEHKNPIIADALDIIEKNYKKSISLAEIASSLHISPTLLSHYFKQELGISVYRYITEKRLIFAHNLISGGVAPTQAYLQSGWRDYSSFYRAYKKMFRTIPSETSD
ncbi:MAG: helix-turn-helix transcriptional regulator [Clostridia bacterium]|nr:helix-turn-helix transcriptional regulator [Clostridia bacterium]